MGTVAKKASGAFVSAIKNAPKTMGKSALDLGKSLTGKNKGNYFENLTESTINSGAAAATLGMTSTKDLGSGNNIDKQLSDVMSPPDLEAPPAVEEGNGMSDAENAALKEEEANAKKKGRASTVLAGGSDSVGSSSARRSLLGSL